MFVYDRIHVTRSLLIQKNSFMGGSFRKRLYQVGVLLTLDRGCGLSRIQRHTKGLSMHTLASFLETGLSLIVYREGMVVFESSDSDLRPLVTYIRTHGTHDEKVVIFDKYVGRAAALLMGLIRPHHVYAGVISQSGAEELKESGIAFDAGREVKYLMDVASEGMCRWEKMAVGKTADELLAELRKISMDESS
jgi:hypothetical protein